MKLNRWAVTVTGGLLICAAVFAHECPPASALYHMAIGQQWALQGIYNKHFRIISSQAKWSSLHTLAGSSVLTVSMLDSANSHTWQVTCWYPVTSPQRKDAITVVVIAQDRSLSSPALNSLYASAGPLTKSIYACKTTANTSEKCHWN